MSEELERSEDMTVSQSSTGGELARRLQVLSALPTPLMTVDRDYNITYINGFGASLGGRRPEELVGTKCYDLFRTGHCRTAECRVAQAIQRGETCTGETVARPSAAQAGLAIRYTAIPERDAAGRIIGAAEFVVDVSEVRTALEDAQAKAELLNNVPTPVMAIDREMNVTFMNQAGAQAVGRSPAACVGRKCHELFNTGHCNTSECRTARAMQQNRVFTSQTVAHLPSGELPIRYTGAPLRDGQGRIIGALEYVVEIVEETQAVDEVQQLVQAFIAGELGARGKPESYQIPGFRSVVQGINETLEAILRPMEEAQRVLDDLAGRELRARMQGDYQGDHARLKDSVNQTADALHDALVQVAEAAEQVSTATSQIASSSQSVSQGASEQASALEETSSTLEEIAGMTQQNAGNTQQARTLALATKAAADSGNKAMARMLESMAKIRAAAEGTAEIIRDINEIAFQTNLLALNAAVEAARAGDAGRGFAVVADEVRSLALRSKEAAKKTEELIRQSVRLSEEGASVSRDVNGNLTEIVTSVARVTEIVSQIATASEEQARGVQQVNKAVAQMDQAVQLAAANSEETSSAAEELASQAQSLAAMVGTFQIQREQSGKRAGALVAATAPRSGTGRRSGAARPAPMLPAARAPTAGSRTARVVPKKPERPALDPANDPDFREF